MPLCTRFKNPRNSQRRASSYWNLPADRTLFPGGIVQRGAVAAAKGARRRESSWGPSPRPGRGLADRTLAQPGDRTGDTRGDSGTRGRPDMAICFQPGGIGIGPDPTPDRTKRLAVRRRGAVAASSKQRRNGGGRSVSAPRTPHGRALIAADRITRTG